MRLARPVLAVTGLLGASLMETASAASPQQLVNKTVTLSWTSQTVERGADGKERQGGANIRCVIYISSLGRLFEHSSRSAKGRTGGGDVDPSAAQTKMGEARGLRFEGKTLVANRGYGGAGGAGAMRAVATFDASYSSCTLAVTHGKESGGVIKRKGIDGVVREYVSISLTGQVAQYRTAMRSRTRVIS